MFNQYLMDIIYIKIYHFNHLMLNLYLFIISIIR